MMACLILVIVFALMLPFSKGQDANIQFSQELRGKSFAVTYRVMAIVEATTNYVSEIREQFHHELQAASIWSVKYAMNEAFSRRSRFIYSNRQEFQIIEPHLSDLRQFFPSDLRPLDDGAETRVQLTNMPIPKVELLNSADGKTIERHLLEIAGNVMGLKRFDILKFFDPSCLAALRNDLHYLRGLTRLLPLLECKKDDIKYDSTLSSSAGRNVYRAYNLKAIHEARADDEIVEYLDIIIETDPNGTSSLPKRIKFKFAPKITLSIDVIRFETFDPPEYLPDYQYSTFRLPLTSSIRLASSFGDTDQPQPKLATNSLNSKQFSFIAHLTGYQDEILLDAIEYNVAFDGTKSSGGLLARQVSLIDRSQVDGDTWRRHTSRTIYARETGLKYHIFHSRRTSIGKTTQNANSCLVDKLEDSGMKALEASGYEFLELDDALFMGMAVMRGIECKIYEKRIYRLPFWLGLPASYEGSEMYLTIYEHSSGSKNSFPVELTIDVLSKAREGKPQVIETSLRLDIQQFSWSLNEDQETLIDVSQDCLLPAAKKPFKVTHARLDLLMSQVEGDTLVASNGLIEDHSLREEVFCLLISQLFNVPKLEQHNLEARPELEQQFHISAKLYELQKTHQLRSKIIGYSTSPPSSELAGEPMTLNREECELEAGHYVLTSSQEVTAMFCPGTLHCILNVTTKKDNNISHGNSNDSARCTVVSVSLRETGDHMNIRSKLLEWKERVDSAEGKAELIGSPIQLNLNDDRQMSFTMRFENIALSEVE